MNTIWLITVAGPDLFVVAQSVFFVFVHDVVFAKKSVVNYLHEHPFTKRLRMNSVAFETAVASFLASEMRKSSSAMCDGRFSWT